MHYIEHGFPRIPRPANADLSAGGEDFKDFILAEKEKNAAVGGKIFAPEKKKPDGDFSLSGTEKMVRFPSNSSPVRWRSEPSFGTCLTTSARRATGGWADKAGPDLPEPDLPGAGVGGGDRGREFPISTGVREGYRALTRPGFPSLGPPSTLFWSSARLRSSRRSALFPEGHRT